MNTDPAGAPTSGRSALSGVRIPGTKLHGPRAVAILAIALYIVLFIALNNDHVKVNFVFFSFRTNELLGSLVIVALGFVAGYIVKGRRVDRQATDAPPPALPAITEPPSSGHDVEAAAMPDPD